MQIQRLLAKKSQRGFLYRVHETTQEHRGSWLQATGACTSGTPPCISRLQAARGPVWMRVYIAQEDSRGQVYRTRT